MIHVSGCLLPLLGTLGSLSFFIRFLLQPKVIPSSEIEFLPGFELLQGFICMLMADIGSAATKHLTPHCLLSTDGTDQFPHALLQKSGRWRGNIRLRLFTKTCLCAPNLKERTLSPSGDRD